MDFGGLVVDGVKVSQAQLRGKAAGDPLAATGQPVSGSYASTVHGNEEVTGNDECAALISGD